MPATTVKAAKDAILAALAAAVPLNAITQTWGGPSEGEDWPTSGEWIYLGDVPEIEQDWAALGDNPLQRNEEYVVPVFVSVRRYGDEERATETRAWAIVELVKAALLDDASLNAVFLAGQPGFRVRGQANQPFGPQQWRTVIRCEVNCVSRLRG